MGVEYATQKELGNLLQQATRWLPPLDLAEATELLTAREYGLALEVIADGLRQTKHIRQWKSRQIGRVAIRNNEISGCSHQNHNAVELTPTHYPNMSSFGFSPQKAVPLSKRSHHPVRVFTL